MAGTVFETAAQGGGGGFRASRCATTPFGTPDAAIAAYDLFCGFGGNETTALQGIDQGFGFRDFTSRDPYAPATGSYTFVDPQFAALDSWRSIGAAAYNGLQVNLRRNMSHGVQFTLNYTYSKSIDLSSDAARINAYGGLGGQVINSWAPKGLRGVSDFDFTHQINANWIVELPFGKGQWLAANAGRGLDAFIGGWQLSGLARWTSGFPIGASNGAEWPTNWELSGFATQLNSIKTGSAHKNPTAQLTSSATLPPSRPHLPPSQRFARRRGKPQHSPRRRFRGSGPRLVKAMALEGKPEPAIPLGRVQRTELDALRRRELEPVDHQYQ